MSRLRDASLALARTGAHAVLPVERLFAIERVAAGLEARRLVSVGDWPELAERAEEKGLGALDVADLRRLLRGIWQHRGHARLAGALVDRLGWDERRGTDRALITAYLLHYPVDHPAFGQLRTAAAAGAERHDWRWREAGRAWRLWDGPDALREGLRGAGDPEALLSEAGLLGRLADGGFVSAARRDAAGAAR